MAIEYKTTPNMGLKYVDNESSTENFTWHGTATAERPSASASPMFLKEVMQAIDTTDMADRLDDLETANSYGCYMHTGMFTKTFSNVSQSGVFSATYTVDTGVVGDPWIMIFFPMNTAGLTGTREADAGIFWFKNKPVLHCDFNMSDNIGYSGLTLTVTPHTTPGSDRNYCTLEFNSPTRVPPHACMIDGAIYYYIILGKKAS